MRRVHLWFSLFAVLGLLLTPLSVSLAQTPEPGQVVLPQGEGPWVVRAYYSDRQLVDDLAAWKEPWEVHHDQGYLVVDVTAAEYERLQEAGFRLEVDEELTAQLNQPNEYLEGQTEGIPGYPCYRTVEETFATAVTITLDYPDLATWIDVGDSWEKTEPGGLDGYDLMVLKLTNANVPGNKPKLFIMSAIHAREYTTAELNTRFAEYLVQNYGVDPDVTWILDYHEIHLLLQANPDGRKHAETGLYWRKNTNNNYCANTNDRGADLNRNFEFQWGCCGGSSGNPCSETYRGPSAASEPETQAVQNYVRSQYPDLRDDPLSDPAPITTTGIFLDIHSYSELVIWPWGFTSQVAPNGVQMQTLGRKFAYFNGYEPGQAIGLYTTDGTTTDFAYGDLGLPAYCFELGTQFFQNCTTFENTILPDNLPAFLYAAKVVGMPYVTPAGPDALNVVATPDSVSPGDAVQLTATINDTRYNNENGTEPTQNIAAAEYYIDVPPWVTTTTPVAYPMGPSDGSFNQTIEGVEAAVDTTGLSDGRHIIFVRGQDVAGNWGAVSAVFLTVEEQPCQPVQILDVLTDTAGCLVTFTASLSGTAPYTYSWDFGAFGSSTATTPMVDFGADGTYPYTLTVENGCGQDDHVGEVTVACAPPCEPVGILSVTTAISGCVVSFGAELTGTAPYSYSWDFGDGGSSSEAMPSHSYISGTYTATLEVVNDCGTDTTSIPVSVACTPCEPPADLAMGWSPQMPGVDEVVSFSGSASGSEPMSYEWWFDGVYYASGASITRTFAMTGDYEVGFRASNDCGDETITDTITIYSETICVPAAIANVSTAISGCVVDFTPEVSGDPPISFEWAFGDGMTSTAEMPSHDYGASGTYTVTLAVENCGGEGVDSHVFQVTVSCEPPSWEVYLPLVFNNW